MKCQFKKSRQHKRKSLKVGVTAEARPFDRQQAEFTPTRPSLGFVSLLFES